MTVAELIEALKRFDPNLPVVTPGFDESGFDDIAPPEQVKALPVRKTSHGPAYVELKWHNPNHNEATGDSFDAVAISF